MVGYAELRNLEKRKQVLLAQSDVLRLSVVLECRNVADSSRWVDRGVGVARSVVPLLPLLVPLAGFIATRKSRLMRRLLTRGFWGWRLFRRLRGLWAASA